MENKDLIKCPVFEWRFLDERSGLPFPWYTEDCLKWLQSIDFSKMSVFEYGGGISTLWWRWNAKEVISVDNNKEWADKAKIKFLDTNKDYVGWPLTYSYANKEQAKFDVIIIDGAWRDECTKIALQCIKKGGYIICDNYHQDSCCPASEWKETDKLLEKYPIVVFHQKGHPDWKTAVWQII